MENADPQIIDLLLEAHIGLDRQGPGSSEVINQALGFLGSPDQFGEIADLGCGTGGQTMILAEHLPGKITGLDMFPSMIGVFNSNAKKKNLENRVKGIVGNMENLPFQQNSLDLIWSEGAIDNIGFREGLSHWRNFLKPSGFLAVSCPSWLTKEHPAEVEQFWSDAGSHLDPIEKNIGIMLDCGYAFIAAFVLPENCWTDNYFYPREKAIQTLLRKYNHSETMKVYAEINRREVDLYMKYKQHYGYVFYIGKAI
ncbi:MAG: class I SAM-dependent methyltransferase [Proteobacteria bacterium]|nr:class I SAM-dependent methyltransferase [Pseudomonadota bacterium]